jgi:predicted Zn-dependent protease with MMP-like domain
MHEISHHFAIHDSHLKTTKEYNRMVASILFF